MMNENVKNAVLFVGGLAVGYGAGYFITQRVLKAKYEEIANEEIESVKETYKALRKEDEYIDPKELVDSLGYSIESPEEDEEYDDSDLEEDDPAEDSLEDDDDEVENEEPAEEAQVLNIFDNEEIYQELPEELIVKEEDQGEIFIISEYKFFNDDVDFEKNTVTYYKGDYTLADERDQVIQNVDRTVGRQHLDMFGTESTNEKTVYVRNKWLGTDFEILLDERRYVEVVLGATDIDDIPWKREKNRVKKMRDDD